MLTVKQHLDAYVRMMEQRGVVEAKQWKKYWENKFMEYESYTKKEVTSYASKRINARPNGGRQNKDRYQRGYGQIERR